MKKALSLLDEKIADTLRGNVREEEVCLVEGEEPGRVISLVIDEGYNQIIQKTHPFHSSEVNTTALLSFNPVAFFDYPVSAVFSPDDVGPNSDARFIYYRKNFCEARQKREVLDGIEGSLLSRVKSTSLRADLITISDELFTNAVFNAPFVDQSNTTSGASRENGLVRMHDGMSGEITLAGDAERILVVCRDSYGTLNPNKMLSRVKNCYAQGVAANINLYGNGGAGIGSYMMFNSSVSFFVAVQERRRTLVGCVLPTTGSGRARASMLKNLHFIFVK